MQKEFNFTSNKKKISPKVKNWLRLMESGELRNKTVVVLRHIYIQDATIYHLRTSTGFPHQTLTAVLSNLMDAGLVVATGQILIGENYYSELSFVHDEFNREMFAEQRQKEKFRLWIKRGLEDFEDEMGPVLYNTLKCQ